MKLRLVFRRGVKGEIAEAHSWYEKQSPGLGDQFAECLEETLEAILARPTLTATLIRDIRFRLLGRFPYAVYYRVVRDAVRVLAVVHTRRDPQSWMSRN